MARGWESKSVESQVDAAREKREQSSAPRRSREEIELESRRQSLEMSRRRIVRELEETQSSLRRSSLEAALAHLDGQLAELDAK